jgi:hypothetical protein
MVAIAFRVAFEAMSNAFATKNIDRPSLKISIDRAGAAVPEGLSPLLSPL